MRQPISTRVMYAPFRFSLCERSLGRAQTDKMRIDLQLELAPISNHNRETTLEHIHAERSETARTFIYVARVSNQYSGAM